MGLTLKLDEGEEISIPSCLADSNLSLAEIGVLFCLTAMQETGEGLHRFDRGEADFLAAMAGLKQKEILTMNFSGKSLSIHLDLDKIQPAQPDEKGEVKG